VIKIEHNRAKKGPLERPITVVNARLSEKSCNNYAKVQPLFNLLHPCLTKILCQTESDAARFECLGVDKTNWLSLVQLSLIFKFQTK